MKEPTFISSDQELIVKLQDRKQVQEAVHYLYKHHFDSLSSFVIHNGGSLQDAEDTFQEALVAFIHMVQQNRFRGESSIKTILFSMNKNLWYSELKRRGRAEQREM